MGHTRAVFKLSEANERVGEPTVNRKELNPDASPQAAYGARLRSLREKREWTQDELGGRVEYSSVHISAVETGRKPPTLRFSRNVDRVLGLNGTDTFERQYHELRRGSLLEGFPEYIGYEGRAVELRLFELGLIPGLLQTPEYARTVAEGDVQRGAISPEQAEERVSFLAERQATLVREVRPPMVLVVIDESCLHQNVGSAEVMDRQLAYLVEVAKMPRWVIQVCPFSMGARRAFNLPINLLTLADRSVMSYAESQTRGHLERDTSAVVPLLTAYHQLQAEAMSQAESVAMIEQLRKGTP